MQQSERVERDSLRSLGSLPGAAYADVDSVVCFAIPALPDVPMVNRTVGLGEDEPATDDILDAIDAFYRGVGVRFYAAVTPDAQPRDLRERLLARAYTRGYDWMKFAQPVPVPRGVDTALEVREADASDFATIVIAAYGLPQTVHATLAAVPSADGFTAYVAYDGRTPASAGAIFVSGDVGWLGFAGTVAEHRGKGGQSAILAARFARAHELGVKTVVTETGVMDAGRASNSYRNILRAGFGELYVRENYLSPAR